MNSGDLVLIYTGSFYAVTLLIIGILNIVKNEEF